MKINIHFDIKVGRIVKFFVLTDLILLSGWGFVEPIFSIFVIQKIVGATLTTVGIAAAIYWVLKSVLQIPVANYLDKIPGEKDDFQALIAGLLVAAFAAFSFALIAYPWQLYLVQAIQAVAFALYIPSWNAIFSRHLDKDRTAFDWSFDSTSAGLAVGISSFFGAVIAGMYGYTIVFMLAAFSSMAAALVLLSVPSLIVPKPTSKKIPLKDHRPFSDPEI